MAKFGDMKVKTELKFSDTGLLRFLVSSQH